MSRSVTLLRCQEQLRAKCLPDGSVKAFGMSRLLSPAPVQDTKPCIRTSLLDMRSLPSQAVIETEIIICERRSMHRWLCRCTQQACYSTLVFIATMKGATRVYQNKAKSYCQALETQTHHHLMACGWRWSAAVKHAISCYLNADRFGHCSCHCLSLARSCQRVHDAPSFMRCCPLGQAPCWSTSFTTAL